MLRSKYNEMTKVMSMKSSIFSDYFHTLMTNHNIVSIRSGMKALIFYFYFEVISSFFSQRGIIYRPVIALVTFVIYFVLFASSMNVMHVSKMLNIASIMVMISMTYAVLIGTDTRELLETRYALTISVILIMYNLFRLRFMVTMLLSLAYILIFLANCNNRMKMLGKVNVTMDHESRLNLERAYGFVFGAPKHFLIGQCILLVLMYFTGMYLRFFNSIRRKSAFLKLAENVKGKLKLKTAIRVQTYWIEAIMPSVVKDEFLKKSLNVDMFSFVYCQMFENVSILFADIVGFTEMSSNKTAVQLVNLLNDLYNRFDEQGKFNKCEKIGTLGDCYYCVSGCPVHRPDHATCCVEMGLAICKIILRFNKDHGESVNMRVGVHSGRVIAAIIGNQRFRFDVYSNDVQIANSLETTGRPGFVHISESTHELVKHAYKCESGDLLHVKQDIEFGIGGMIQKTMFLKTYFIITERKNAMVFLNPFSVYESEWIKETTTSGHETTSRNNRFSDDMMELFDNNSNQENNNFRGRNANVEEDLNLIRFMQHDPEKTVDLFKRPPLDKMLLTFIDGEIEHQYLYHTTDQIEVLYVDSMKTALMFDCIAALFFSTIILLAGFVMIPRDLPFRPYYVFVYILTVVICLIGVFISLVYKSEITNVVIRYIYCFFSHPFSRLLLSMIMSSMPSFLVLSLYNPYLINKSYQYTSAYFSLSIFAVIGNALSTTTCSLLKQLSTIIFSILPIWLLTDPYENRRNFDLSMKINDFKVIPFLNFQSHENEETCAGFLKDISKFQSYRLIYHYGFQMIFISVLVFYLTRENEKNIRIHFYATREAGIQNAEAIRAKKKAEALLYNIIPKHVFAKIMNTKWKNKKNMKFGYAHDIKNAGIVFACISNFFSKYYREDYKSGEPALRLLHTIICTFDNLLQRPAYKSLDKIKTINDCYMIASGLNLENDDKGDNDHLINLMHYALDLHIQLVQFNDQNVIGSTRFTLKVGYNFGPVTAGIIGNTKPLYDVWGDTVNVASRMYSTVPVGNIQVPDYVEEKLRDKFEFSFRGEVPIKGKGNMITFLVVRSYEKSNILLTCTSR